MSRPRHRILSLALVASLVPAVLVGCAQGGADANLEPPGPAAVAATVPPGASAADAARLFADVPVVAGATHLKRTSKDIYYLIPGGRPAYDRTLAFYDSELRARGWRFRSQDGAAKVYEQQGIYLALTAQAIESGEVVINILRND